MAEAILATSAVLPTEIASSTSCCLLFKHNLASLTVMGTKSSRNRGFFASARRRETSASNSDTTVGGRSSSSEANCAFRASTCACHT